MPKGTPKNYIPFTDDMEQFLDSWCAQKSLALLEKKLCIKSRLLNSLMQRKRDNQAAHIDPALWSRIKEIVNEQNRHKKRY